MKTTDTALLGHVSAEALSASALSDLWTMCTAMFLQGRVLGILVGAAVGAGNHKVAGAYLQVSYFVIGIISVFVFCAWNVTAPLWKRFGSEPHIADEAGYYARVMSFSIPGLVAFSQMSQYFSAQRILYPEVNTATIALILNLSLGLVFVLGIPFPSFNGFGFVACPIVTAVVVYLQFAFFFLKYIHHQRLHEPCWDGWSWNHITTARVKTFVTLYFPAAMGSASDFWRVAVIGAIAAKLGETEVAVFNTSYRIMWIVLILVNAISSASAIKMSMRLGNMDPNGARQAGLVAISLSFVILVVISALVFVYARGFGMIFTQDEKFMELFAEARLPFATTVFLMCFSVAIEKVPYSMGRTNEVFWMGLIASWGAQVPAVFFLTQTWRNDLVGLFSGMSVGYAVLVVLYGYIAATSDWTKYAQLARDRSET